ncbi:hypothetical protein OVA13_13740 [Pseudoxanthomonas sp. SL93]|jgi:hypothetical protein|uniref:hypothetical protein n=1 Tax=Pseudoxanthomonas sp. SL93 TaxID=2995142 RepID=UPI00227186E4|nr:hypothetical protein [Pseudoxanthomonas sp. SL93]WAC62445.1 hypothetical protein OVA13_13740 [Pseudoxanthomonas sp. SL93]
MHWLFLLLGIGSLFIAMRTASMALMVVCLLASLALFVLWIVGWYSQRVGDSSRNDVQMIDPAELRRLREIAEARRNATTPPGEPPPL